ncbi:hypothetical protein OHB35_51320 [Streptomyces phaeochromogenes]|uniref:Uncharacterized protein n=1 Tax=Streptomyces phaeochromogenes TaxID=1923 RepID=A0ABZ1HQT6_STRPH|nr:hypothetical protein [Streptomyces phaeochromogenes]WSD20969.1 hypothetical protein OHB35_51320 [Streptomyces phaeochromogenes]
MRGEDGVLIDALGSEPRRPDGLPGTPAARPRAGFQEAPNGGSWSARSLILSGSANGRDGSSRPSRPAASTCGNRKGRGLCEFLYGQLRPLGEACAFIVSGGTLCSE